MEISADMEILAIVLTFVVHVIGAGILVWNLMDQDPESGSWRDWWPKDDQDPEPPPEPTGPQGDGLQAPTLPDAQPSPVRLREPGRIGDRRDGPSRRPSHPAVPERTPAREREQA